MTYDRLLPLVIEDVQKLLKPVSWIVADRSDRERVRVVAGNGRMAARAMLDLLNALPSAVGASSEVVFVAGFEPLDGELLSDKSREDVKTWQDWKSFFYESALDLRLDDGPPEAQLAFARRVAEIVSKELDLFLTPRLLFFRPDLEDRRWR